MPIVQIEAQLSPDKLLSAVNQLDEQELEQFVLDVNELVAKRKAPSVTRTEAELLLQINQGIAPEVQTRYDELIIKRQQEQLMNDEYQELLGLTRETEQVQAARTEYLAELARLRGTSLTRLMENLGIPAPVYG